MIYTEKTKKAMQVSYSAHKDQVDKAGTPYIFHPIHVAEQMEDETTVCVALLHDVVEDTEMTFEQLLHEGFPGEVVDALRVLTHDLGVPYMEYIEQIKESRNRHAIAVKCADLVHNSDLTRFPQVDRKALDRVAKYKQALRILEGTGADKPSCSV
jgi:(p)ppGpp synthase/HD superfamily hydrolase